MQVKLVVLDSVAFLFRVNQYTANKRLCMLHTMMWHLRKLASREIAVVIINQVTQRLDKDIVPALGDSWYCEPMHRIQLSVIQATRVASVWTSSCLPPASAKYAITVDGIRDVDL